MYKELAMTYNGLRLIANPHLTKNIEIIISSMVYRIKPNKLKRLIVGYGLADFATYSQTQITEPDWQIYVVEKQGIAVAHPAVIQKIREAT